MSKIKEHFYDEIEQRALFAYDSRLSNDEAFECLSCEGVDEITWDKSLNNDYSQWQYFNLK